MATPEESPTAIRGVSRNSRRGGGGLNIGCEAPKFVTSGAQCSCAIARNSVNHTCFNTVPTLDQDIL